MNIAQVIILALIQGAAELLPVSSSAHVIVAEKLMGLDPSSPQMTFLLVMLHTGTMFAVLFYFWRRWKVLLTTPKKGWHWVRMIGIATVFTGGLGLLLKKIIEKTILLQFQGGTSGEIEALFSSLPLISGSLFCAGALIIAAGIREAKPKADQLNTRNSILIGLVQGFCLPFRGFSRSGATISSALLLSIPRALAEDFSFALAVVLTPPVIYLELHRLLKAGAAGGNAVWLHDSLVAGLLGMIFSFGAGVFALRWLSAWLEKGKWKFFGFYCVGAGLAVIWLHGFFGY